MGKSAIFVLTESGFGWSDCTALPNDVSGTLPPPPSQALRGGSARSSQPFLGSSRNSPLRARHAVRDEPINSCERICGEERSVTAPKTAVTRAVGIWTVWYFTIWSLEKGFRHSKGRFYKISRTGPPNSWFTRVLRGYASGTLWEWFHFLGLVPRRCSLVERAALRIMGLIVRGSLGVVGLIRTKSRNPPGSLTINPSAPCFPALLPSTEQYLWGGYHFPSKVWEKVTFLSKTWKV